jgi:HSP20 family protein
METVRDRSSREIRTPDASRSAIGAAERRLPQTGRRGDLMENVVQALDEVKELYRKMLGHPAPDIDPKLFVPFPPGVDPVAETLDEVRRLKKLTESVAAIPVMTWIPRADCYSIPEGYLVHVGIPGVRREDLKVFTVGGELVVRGTRNAVPGARALSVERPSGPFERRFAIPAGSTVEGMTARYTDGILELTLPVKTAALTEEKAVPVA